MSRACPDRVLRRLADAAQRVELGGLQQPLAARDAARLAWLAIEGPPAGARTT
ncbi:hypothetical protein [Roseateles sp. P5_E11]